MLLSIFISQLPLRCRFIFFYSISIKTKKKIIVFVAPKRTFLKQNIFLKFVRLFMKTNAKKSLLRLFSFRLIFICFPFWFVLLLLSFLCGLCLSCYLHENTTTTITRNIQKIFKRIKQVFYYKISHIFPHALFFDINLI